VRLKHALGLLRVHIFGLMTLRLAALQYPLQFYLLSIRSFLMIKTLIKIAVVIGILCLAYTVYYWDAITGQWKFEALCKKEGGSRFYAPVEKDVGWEVVSNNDKKAYKIPFGFGGVSFVRFKDEDGTLKDVYITTGETRWMKGYDIQPADMILQPRYKLNLYQGHVQNDNRMSRTSFSISDIRNGSLVAEHTYFSYEWTSPDGVLLNTPTSVTCKSGSEVNLFFSSIRKSGSK
jgi:hypothetical protein